MFKKIFLLTFLFSSQAFAHPFHGEGAGFIGGMAHPLLGLDHLLAMIAVGLWAGQMRGRAWLFVPASFLLMMTVGAGLGLLGLNIPYLETGIAASVFVLGLLVATKADFSKLMSLFLVSGFSLFHGNAHGLEKQAGGSVLHYFVGFVLTTAMLHALGVGITLLMQKCLHRPRFVQLAGVALAAFSFLFWF